MTAAYIVTFLRLLVGGIFALSAAGKLRDLRAFRAALVGFAVSPGRFVGLLSWLVVASEAAVVLLLVVGGWGLLGGFGLAAALLVLFSAVLGSTLRQGKQLRCNCFGPTEREISPYDLGRNAVLIGCCAAGLTGYAATRGAVTAGDVAVEAVMAACFVVIVANLGDIVESLRGPFGSPGAG